MSRLTKRGAFNIALCMKSGTSKCRDTEDCIVCKQNTAIIEKLAHYEDLEEQGRLIVIEPNELKRDELDRCTHRHCNKCDGYRRELQHYKEFAEAGRLIELPCAVGDTVYWITTQGVLERYVFSIEPFHSKLVELHPMGLEDEVYSYPITVFFKNFGEHVFLTKAEAEAKLAEMGGAE